MTIHPIVHKLSEMNQLTLEYLKEIQLLLRKNQQGIYLLNYFTYTMDISHNSDDENICFGNYYIHNVSQKTITNPYICIKITGNFPVEFSGKYVYKETKTKLMTPQAWERMNDRDDREEYWLKPVGTNELKPNESLAFQNFQLKWKGESEYSGSVNGFTYADLFQDGLTSMNQINMSGRP